MFCSCAVCFALIRLCESRHTPQPVDYLRCLCRVDVHPSLLVACMLLPSDIKGRVEDRIFSDLFSSCQELLAVSSYLLYRHEVHFQHLVRRNLKLFLQIYTNNPLLGHQTAPCYRKRPLIYILLMIAHILPLKEINKLGGKQK